MSVNDQPRVLEGRAVFVSASIPDASRWQGEFDALEITDAVVAVARAVIGNGGRLVTAAHPTIAPLLLYIAAEMQLVGTPQVAVYQSALYDAVLPAATRRFEADGIGSITRTNAVPGESPVPGQSDGSLDVMRRQMLNDEQPVAGIFVGGMDGIPVEHRLFGDLRPGMPTYAFGRPGGESRALVGASPEGLRDVLAESDVYPSVARQIIDDIGRDRSYEPSDRLLE